MGAQGIRHNKLFPLKVLDRVTVIFLYRAYHRHFGRWILEGQLAMFSQYSCRELLVYLGVSAAVCQVSFG